MDSRRAGPKPWRSLGGDAIECFDDLIEMLQTHPEWRQQLRQLVLTDELIGLPDLVAELVGASGSPSSNCRR
ncbi:hypothetical protein BH23ACT7_BH23ACT7_27690 [soil metagenome]